MISHTDARLAARCAAISCDIRSRSTGCAVSRVTVRLNADPALATSHLTVAGNGVGAGSAVGNRDVISHTDACLTTRCAAVSGDVWSRSTGCAVCCVSVCLNADPGLATGQLTVAGNGVRTSCAVGFVNH